MLTVSVFLLAVTTFFEQTISTVLTILLQDSVFRAVEYFWE